VDHLAELVQILTAAGLALTGMSSAFNVYLTWSNGQRAKKIASVVYDIRKQTNGINDQLVKVTGEAEFAKGLKEGETRSS
jgi:hypothetical protein